MLFTFRPVILKKKYPISFQSSHPHMKRNSSFNHRPQKKAKTERDKQYVTNISHEYTDWPAPKATMDAARVFIKECVKGKHRTLLVPDKDADGLSSGKIMHYTLTALGLPPELIEVHLLGKDSSVFQPHERAKMEAYGAERVIVMDQGSRGGPALVTCISTNNEDEPVPTLILDHHQSDVFPESSLVVTACKSPPIATSSLLTYLVCLPLHETIREGCAIPALLGVFGDLGPSAVKWGQGPWPAYLGDVAKRETKKAISEAVSMINAPRRTAEYRVFDAWEAILKSESLQEIRTNRALVDARTRVNEEVERRTHVAPAFSQDGRVALLRIHSAYQVHPVIATRWAGYLRAKNLQVVMVANDGYHPSGQHTNFSCRILSSLRGLSDDQRPNIIEILKEYAAKIEDKGFFDRVGGDFASGHKEASGGIILTSDFELLVNAMKIGVKPEPAEQKVTNRTRPLDPRQKTKLTSYFSPVKDSDRVK